MRSIMVTIIRMERWGLITKERMEKFCKGEEPIKDSVNDDLESFFEELRLGKEPNKRVKTYYLPKLTKAELKLIERKDSCYLQTFNTPFPDVDKAEMMLSESNSKFVQGVSTRTTFTFINQS